MSLSFSSEYLDQLNGPQREAVEYVNGPLMVIAGAGSGKTRVITYRIAHLISQYGIPAHQILAVTFTNKAASEMRGRVLNLLGLPPDTHFPIGTFHSRCASILRREAMKVGLSERYQILDDDDQTAVVKEVIRRLEMDPKKVQPSQAIAVITEAKIRMLGPDDISDIEEMQGPNHSYPQIYKVYQDFLEKSDAVDFDDLLLKVVWLFEKDAQTLAYWQRRYQQVLVDEYQDTNPVQFRLVELLAGEHRNLCVVGDEDQSIYSWRGADIHNLLDFQQHFENAHLVRLEQNYRSTKRILRAADSVIRNNRQRIGKTLFTEGEEGLPISYHRALDGTDEARWVAEQLHRRHLESHIPYNEMAVFYRINSLSRSIEDALRYAAVPYRVVGSVRFYDRAEIKDMLSYLRLSANPGNDVALLRVINVPRRGMGEAAVEILRNLSRERNISLFDAGQMAIGEDLLSRKAAPQLQKFIEQILGWRQVHQELAPKDLLQKILDDTHYFEEELGDSKSLDAITRQENIEELLNTLAEYRKENPKDGIEEWLERITLTSAVDSSQGDSQGVSLMTLHCAKGLEFDSVFMIALEEPLFPLQRSVEDHGDAEEERRLFYVGLTRARRFLALTHSQVRMIYGRDSMNPISCFLREIPGDVFTDGKGPHGKQSHPQSHFPYMSWGRYPKRR